MEYCRLAGLHAERQNTGVAMLPGKGGRPQPVRFGAPGTGDILILLPSGRHLEIEAKAEGTYPSPAQGERILGLNRAGALAFWCRDFAVARVWIERIVDLDARAVPFSIAYTSRSQARLVKPAELTDTAMEQWPIPLRKQKKKGVSE